MASFRRVCRFDFKYLDNGLSFKTVLLLGFVFCNVATKTAAYGDFESYCGEVALECIKNCQVFKHKCGASYVAEVVKNAKPGRISDVRGDWNSPTFANKFNYNEIKYQEACKTQGNVCVVVREYERSECCPEHYCVPFERQNGQNAAIGSCKKLEYNEKFDRRSAIH